MQFYPNFFLFSTLGGINLDHDFFQLSKLSENQKKSLHQKWNTFFPRIQVETCAQMQIIGGDTDKDHNQIIGGGDTVKLLRGYIPSNREGLILGHCGLRRRRIHKMRQSPLLRRVFLCGGLNPQRRNAAKTLTLKFKKTANRTTQGGEFKISKAYLRTEPPKVVSLKFV